MGKGGGKRNGRGRGRHGRGEDEHGRGEDEHGRGEDEHGRGPGFQEPSGEKGKQQPGAGKEKHYYGKAGLGGGGKIGPHLEGDASSQATTQAKKEAAAKMRNALAHQRTFADIPKFTLDMRVEKDLMKNIQRFLHQRTHRFGGVQATACQNVPVSPPYHSGSDDESDEANVRPDEITYHILVFWSIHGKLEVLIREYDGYVIAIRVQPDPEDKNQNQGWFTYKDVRLPVHLFGEKNWKMSYGSGYRFLQFVEMGDGCLDQLVKELVGINAANCKMMTFKRGRMLETLNVFAGEVQRLSVILRFFLINLGTVPWVPLAVLSTWANHWANLGDAIMRVVLALLAKRLLKKEDAANVAMKQMGKANDSLKAFKGKAKDSPKASKGKANDSPKALKGTPPTQDDNIPVENDSRKPFEASLTQDELMDKIPAEFRGLIPEFVEHVRMHEKFVSGDIARGDVFGADVPGDELSLPLLMGYIMLMKYHKKLVPKLILREKAYAAVLKAQADALKDKEKAAESKLK